MSIHSLMFGWEYPPLHLGGLGVACQGLVKGLMHHGVRVTLVLPHAHGKEKGIDILYPTEDALHANINIPSILDPYDTVTTYASRIEHIPREMNDVYGENLPEAIAMFTGLSAQMTAHTNPDVIHCHDWMTYGAGARAAAHHEKPLVAHIHATELDRTHFQPNQWIYDCERSGLMAADRIIAVSNYTKGILTEHYGIPADRIHVVHNGSSDMHPVTSQASVAQSKTPKPPMVLFLGRLTIQKGPMHFLDMAAKIHEHRPDVQFVMAGDGHMLGQLMHRACELGLQDSIVFAGKVSQKEAKHLFQKADCFVMPSLSEPFGLVALEAISHGTPVIVSKQSGVGEVLGHAFKVNFWDIDLMADCVLTILREKPLTDQLVSQAPHALRHLTWSNQAGMVTSLYKHLIES